MENNIKIDLTEFKEIWNTIEEEYKATYLNKDNSQKFNDNNAFSNYSYLIDWYDKFFHYMETRKPEPLLITFKDNLDSEYKKRLEEQLLKNQPYLVIPDIMNDIKITKIPYKCSMCGEEFEDIWDYAYCPKCRELYLIIRDQILDKFINKNE